MINGISLDKINLSFVDIDGLYIKLDKKFILNAKKIKIKKQIKSLDSKNELLKLIKSINLIKSIFQEIDIDRIIFKDEEINFLYKDDIFFIDSKFLNIFANIEPTSSGFYAKIDYMEVKDLELRLKGIVKADLVKEKADYYGTYDTFNMAGDLKLTLENGLIKYYVNTADEVDSIAPFMVNLERKVDIEQEVASWIYRYIIAKKYKLEYLYGEYNYKTGNFFPDKMRGLAKAKDVKVKFHKDVEPVFIKDLDITLKKNRLSFKLKNPIYKNIKILDSDIYIYNLLTEGAGIVVSLRTEAMFDEKIHQILNAYDINVPIDQTEGVCDAVVVLNMPFDPFKVDAKGYFRAKRAKFNLAGLPVATENVEVSMHNDIVKIIDTNIQYEDIFNVNTTGEFNTNKRIYKGDADIKSLSVGLGENKLLDTNFTKTDVNINFSEKNSTVRLGSLGAYIDFSPRVNTIKIDNFSSLYEYSPFLKKMGFKSGNALIKTEDFEKYEANAKIYDIPQFLKLNNSFVRDLDLDVVYKDDTVDIASKDGRISGYVNKDVNIYFKDYDFAKDKIRQTKSGSFGKKININAKNSSILFEDKRIIRTDEFNIELGDNYMDFKSIYRKNKLFYKESNGKSTISTQDIDADYINDMGGVNAFKGGSFDFSAKGENDILKGDLKFKKTIIKDLALYNNVLAFINTVPSLVVFQNPAFSSSGYKVKNGTVSFVMRDDVLIIKKIDIKGYSADIKGSGYIDLHSDTINIDITLTTLKNVSTVLRHIPFAGYLFLGEDGKISTNIKITGSAIKPTIKSRVTADAATAPLEIIKRTLMLPFNPFVGDE